jgi:hypothetical protein
MYGGGGVCGTSGWPHGLVEMGVGVGEKQDGTGVCVSALAWSCPRGSSDVGVGMSVWRGGHMGWVRKRMLLGVYSR